MPKHIARLVFLLLAFAVIAYAAKQYFTADSFYLFGHYRGLSVAEIASDKPKFKTPQSCEQCHAARYAGNLNWRQLLLVGIPIPQLPVAIGAPAVHSTRAVQRTGV